MMTISMERVRACVCGVRGGDNCAGLFTFADR